MDTSCDDGRGYFGFKSWKMSLSVWLIEGVSKVVILVRSL